MRRMWRRACQGEALAQYANVSTTSNVLCLYHLYHSTRLNYPPFLEATLAFVQPEKLPPGASHTSDDEPRAGRKARPNTIAGTSRAFL